MLLRPPMSTRPNTLLAYTTLLRARRGDVADLQVREKPHQRIGIADRRVRDVGPPGPGQLQRLAAARAESPCVPALVVPLERDVRAVQPQPEEPIGRES